MDKFAERAINVLPTPSDSSNDKSEWHSRGYLPHFEGGPIPQSITFRLSDSLPTARMREWAQELAHLPSHVAENKRRMRIEEYLDLGMGNLWLARPPIADLVEQALFYFDGERYCLHAWVVMPNHIHVLVTPNAGHDLSGILQAWKSFTAKKANEILGRTGAFWQQEYFDRFIRHEQHLKNAVHYIESNPVNAGLCEYPESWLFSSARWRVKE